ncbi:unnamed protein product [Paramecium sonneborni]|uniref:Uncharacterized protein n=1 Tax=Paramecium sonneborni TaxID=65129 RepID=A0A8S1QYI0_9CILI|nr:unnamed protein product [Paramecium sonneborni]
MFQQQNYGIFRIKQLKQQWQTYSFIITQEDNQLQKEYLNLNKDFFPNTTTNSDSLHQINLEKEYKESFFHRDTKNLMALGGDFTKLNGPGGRYPFIEKKFAVSRLFEDSEENFKIKLIELRLYSQLNQNKT